MDALVFEQACLASTLRTLALEPEKVLSDKDRLPPNVGDALLRMARPTWIGKGYRPGGVLLIGKNPAGGTPSHQHKAHPSDAGLAAALQRLVSERDLRAYLAWRDEAQPRAMATWRIWKNGVEPIVNALKPAIAGADEIAFGNFVPFRSDSNKVRLTEYLAGWQNDLEHVVRLLRPRLIIKMTAEFPHFERHISEVQVLRFSRANGDTHVTAAGVNDLQVMRAWASKFPDGLSAVSR